MLLTSEISEISSRADVRCGPQRRGLDGGIGASVHLETDSGWKKASDIVPGDQVLTLDHGMRTVWNVRAKTMNSTKDSLPLIITVGAVGNCREFMVRDRQVVLFEMTEAEKFTGSRYVLVHASDLIGFKGISRIVPPKDFEVISLEFQNDEVVCAANGSYIFFPKSDETKNDGEASHEFPEYRILTSKFVTSLVSVMKSDSSFQISVWENGRDAQVGCRCADR